MKDSIHRKLSGLARLPFGLLVLGLVWHWASSRSPILARYVLPPFSEVWESLVDLYASGKLWQHIVASLWRTLTGFSLAAVTGVPFGLVLGRYHWLYRLFEPIIEVLRPVSPIAWIPLSILWFGIGEASKVFLVWLLAFFVILVNTIAGVMRVERRLVEAALTLGAGERQLFAMVILPAALPSVLTGLRLGLGLAFAAIVIAEMIAARVGIGYMMERGRAVVNPAQVLIGMALLTVLGYLLNQGFLALQGRWYRAR